MKTQKKSLAKKITHPEILEAKCLDKNTIEIRVKVRGKVTILVFQKGPILEDKPCDEMTI